MAAYPWLGLVTAVSVAEARDDRFVTAFDLGDRYIDPEGKRKTFNPPFSVAYLVRAVTPGSLRAPGGSGRGDVQPGRPCTDEFGPPRRRARAMSVATSRHAGSLCVTTNK